MVHGLSTVSKLIKSASMDKINENQEIGCSWTIISDASLIIFMHNA
jgi:hypothetical protein